MFVGGIALLAMVGVLSAPSFAQSDNMESQPQVGGQGGLPPQIDGMGQGGGEGQMPGRMMMMGSGPQLEVDGNWVYVLRGDQLIKLSSDLKVVAQVNLPPQRPMGGGPVGGGGGGDRGGARGE